MITDIISRYLYFQIEDVFNESMQIVHSNKRKHSLDAEVKLWFMIEEANHLCKKLNKPYVCIY